MTSTSSSTSTYISPTSTAVLALVTPFVPPSGCLSNLWNLASVNYTYINYSTSPHTVATLPLFTLASQYVASCSPSGWSSITAAPTYLLSPAVCPSDWTAYQLDTSVNFIASNHAEEYSTAFCCSRDFKLVGTLSNLPSMRAPCVRTIPSEGEPVTVVRTSTSTRFGISSATTSDIAGTPTIVTIKDGLQVHAAWPIAWQESDTSTMSPKPPALTNHAVIPMWVPGTEVPSGMYDRPDERLSSEQYFGKDLYYFMIVGVPIIVVFIALSITACCIGNSRAKKRERAAASSAIDSGLVK